MATEESSFVTPGKKKPATRGTRKRKSNPSSSTAEKIKIPPKNIKRSKLKQQQESINTASCVDTLLLTTTVSSYQYPSFVENVSFSQQVKSSDANNKLSTSGLIPDIEIKIEPPESPKQSSSITRADDGGAGFDVISQQASGFNMTTSIEETLKKISFLQKSLQESLDSEENGQLYGIR